MNLTATATKLATPAVATASAAIAAGVVASLVAEADTLPTDGLTAVYVDAEGQLAAEFSSKAHTIAEVTLSRVVEGSGSEETVAVWINHGEEGDQVLTLQALEPNWQPKQKLGTLDSQATYRLYADYEDEPTGTAAVSFTLAQLERLLPHQVITPSGEVLTKKAYRSLTY